MKEYRVKIKVQNNYMLTAMQEEGITNAHQLAKASGVGPTKIGRFLNLQETPYTKEGDIKKSVVALAAFLRCDIFALFPPEHLHTPLKTNKGEVEVSAEDIELLLEDMSPDFLIEKDERKTALSAALSTLTEREQIILSSRFGLEGEQMTLEKVGNQLGLSRNRIRHIEARALRKLRHPSNADNLR